jgi:uncharacterized membrane protein YqhA
MNALNKIMSLSRYIVLIAVFGTLVASLTLLVYEAIVVIEGVSRVIQKGVVSSDDAKLLAVYLIQAADVFLIAIAVYMISLGLYVLFIDNRVSLPSWLVFRDLEDLKANLVSIVIAVLAVLFLREAISWDGTRNLLELGAAFALMIGVLVFFLSKKGDRQG